MYTSTRKCVLYTHNNRPVFITIKRYEQISKQVHYYDMQQQNSAAKQRQNKPRKCNGNRAFADRVPLKSSQAKPKELSQTAAAMICTNSHRTTQPAQQPRSLVPSTNDRLRHAQKIDRNQRIDRPSSHHPHVNLKMLKLLFLYPV